MDDSIEVRELEHGDLTVANVALMEDLLNQLSTQPRKLTLGRLHEVYHSNARVLIAIDRVTDRIIGMVTLSIPPKLYGRTAWSEDLVVDEHYRRNGVGRALMEAMLEVAEDFAVTRICATSSRPASQDMVRTLGFAERNTKVFAIDLIGNQEEMK